MSEKSFRDQNCLLCYNCLDYDQSQLEPVIQLGSIIQTCIKHIPKEIVQTVSWNQFEEVGNVSFPFCKKCFVCVSELSKLNSDLEEIQRKIGKLVNLLLSHVKEQRRTQHCGYSVPRFLRLDTAEGVCSANVSPGKSEKEHEVTNHHFPFNNSDEAENVPDFANTLDSGNKEYDNSDEGVSQKAVVDKNCVSQSKATSLKSFVIPPDHVKPKSGLQKMFEGSSGYECSTCHKKFSRYTIMKKHDCSKPTVECEICGMSFSGVGVLKIHTRSHTGEKPFKCETCGKAFSIKAHLRDHMGVHTGEKTFECEICQKKFQLKSNMIRHKSLVHTRVEDKLFKCDVCFENFTSLSNLKTHMVKHSSGTPTPFKCNICEKAFAASKYVLRHIERVHANEDKSFVCDICGKRFLRNYELKTHALTHNEDKPFQCSFCEKSLKCESYLKTHESTHTQKATFDCSACGKSFTAAKILKNHLRYHKENKICEF